MADNGHFCGVKCGKAMPRWNRVRGGVDRQEGTINCHRFRECVPQTSDTDIEYGHNAKKQQRFLLDFNREKA